MDVPVGSLRDVPNQITAARLAVTVACFVALSWDAYFAGLLLFALAAATDWADGYWARRWGPITKLGRVLDPLADKLLICGTFIYLAATPGSDVAPWMAVVVLTRELVVTALRSFVEAEGGDFSAQWLGKWKMVSQCLAAALSLTQVAGWPLFDNFTGETSVWRPEGISSLDLVVWTSIALTIASGLQYVFAAVRMTRGGDDA